MSGAEVEVLGLQELIIKLKKLENFDFNGIKAAIGQSLRTSTMERFRNQEDPEGKKWVASIRTKESGGSILSDTSILRNSIGVYRQSKSVELGTNTIYAAAHQFGDQRIIRAKGRAIKRNIPKRSFLGLNDEDIEEIKGMFEKEIIR